MRILIVLPFLLLALAAAARAAANPNAPYRPPPRVQADPAAWYSPALFKPMGKRYEGLKAFYAKRGMKAEAEWIERRLRECSGESGPAPAKPPA
jgi:hypothetical protein